MAEVNALPSRISTEGAQRLLIALQNDIASGRDLGPRVAQIQSLGLSLENASQHLRCEVERICVGPLTEDPGGIAENAERMRLRDELMHLAEAFMRLGAVARTYRI